MAGTTRSDERQASVNDTLGFIPASLIGQCRSLIIGYHDLYGYACLPDILWRARLGQLIEKRRDFQQLLRQASTTRSAKRSNDGFVAIATAILSLEILASDFSGWSVMFPEARLVASGILQCHVGSSYTPLIENYLYPPKHVNFARFIAVAPPSHLFPADADMRGKPTPELNHEKQTLCHANALLRELHADKVSASRLSRTGSEHATETPGQSLQT